MDANGEKPSGFSQSFLLRMLPIAAVLMIGPILIGCAGEPETNWLGIDVRLSSTPSASQPTTAPTVPAERDVDFRLMNELGVAQLRIDLMNWAKIQSTPDGRYDFTSSDAIVRLAQQNGIDILAACSSVPAWASNTPATGLPSNDRAQAFAAFVQAFVERYDGDGASDMPGLRRPIRAYECFAEMENAPPAAYATCLKIFHDTVKAASSKAKVVLGSLTSPGVKDEGKSPSDHHTYFERLLVDPALQGPQYPYFDVVGFYNFPRRFAGRPPFEHAVIYLQQAMSARHVVRPLWLTRFGTNSNDALEGADQRQATDLVCWAIHARTLGIDRMYLHTLLDIPSTEGDKAADAFGLVRSATPGGQVVPKPAFHALKMLLGILKTQGYVTRRAEGIYMLAGQKEPTYVLWKVASYDPSSFLIPGWWSIRTLNGQEAIRQGTEIKLTYQPIFLKPAQSPFIH